MLLSRRVNTELRPSGEVIWNGTAERDPAYQDAGNVIVSEEDSAYDFNARVIEKDGGVTLIMRKSLIEDKAKKYLARTVQERNWKITFAHTKSDASKNNLLFLEEIGYRLAAVRLKRYENGTEVMEYVKLYKICPPGIDHPDPYAVRFAIIDNKDESTTYMSIDKVLIDDAVHRYPQYVSNIDYYHSTAIIRAEARHRMTDKERCLFTTNVFLLFSTCYFLRSLPG